MEYDNDQDSRVSTPSRRRSQEEIMSTPIPQRTLLPSTPLVIGTPRTPFPQHNLNSPYLNVNRGTPINQRGDIGRGISRVLIVPQTSQFPHADDSNVPGTPENWRNHSNASTPRGDHGHESYSPMNSALSPDNSLFHTTRSQPVLVGTTVGNNLSNNDESASGSVIIWGTDIETRQAANQFRHFIDNFTIDNDFEPYYLHQLEVIHRTESFILNLNCQHLREYLVTRKLHNQLITYPQDILPILDNVINDIYSRMYSSAPGQLLVQTRVFGLETVSAMRQLEPSDIEKLVAVKGMIIRTSPVIPDLQMAFFRCFVCSHTVEVPLSSGRRIEEPRCCPSCQRLGSLQMINNQSVYSDKQLVRVQETPDEIPEGETPFTATVYVFGELVDSVRPGDRVEITGVFRAVPRRVNPKQRSLASVFKTYIDVIHIRRIETTVEECISSDSTRHSNSQLDSGPNSSTRQFTVDRIQQFKEFAANGNVYDKLTRAFAPSIWGMDDAKRGILCLLFGGTLPEAKERARRMKKRQQQQFQKSGRSQRRRVRINIPSESDPQNSNETEYINDMNDILDDQDEVNERTIAAADDDDDDENEKQEIEGSQDTNSVRKVRQRGDINILLCGDPGTSKSQLLSYVHKITPRGIYTSGKGSSAVGLTASVVRDPETRDMVLESGALVLSDNGICCIDEFDKMSDVTRAILHEAMEQQTVSITKAGIIATLNARTSILASANPVQSRYNPRMSVVENIKLPPTLLSRFDLIYLILDTPNPETDRRLARHLVSLYFSDEVRAARKICPEVDQGFLKDYIAYARSTVAPEISEDAVEGLVQGYLSMRAMGGRGSKTISATPRQLESLIRISQALAKMRLSDIVLRSDVDEAIRLMRVATQTAATDPRTGTIDMDMIATGKTALDRDLVFKLTEQLRAITSTHLGQRITVGQLRQILIREAGVKEGNSLSVAMTEVEEAVRELEAEGLLQYIPRTQTAIIRTAQ